MYNVNHDVKWLRSVIEKMMVEKPNESRDKAWNAALEHVIRIIDEEMMEGR